MQNQIDIHTFFGLTYANYLVVPRSVLQSMPDEWQYKFVELIEQVPDYTEFQSNVNNYIVKARDKDSKFTTDPLSDYKHCNNNIFGLR